MQVAREYREDVGSPSYQQILHVLNQVNEERTQAGEPPVSFRQAVHAMGLKDPFTGKIKSGVYVPTLERLEALSQFLGVEPTVFDTYVKRYADKIIREDGMLETFRKMASLRPKQQEFLRGAIEEYVSDIFHQMDKKPRRIIREPVTV